MKYTVTLIKEIQVEVEAENVYDLDNKVKPLERDGLKVASYDKVDDEKTPYCTDCGNDDLVYIDQYTNGEYWKCKECGKEFIW